MPYTKTNWTDRVVSKPLTYTFQNNGDGTTTLIPAEGTITTPGTAITSVVMNNLEKQYDQAMADVANLYLAKSGGVLTGALFVGTGATANIFTADNDNGQIVIINDASKNIISSLIGDGSASRDIYIEGLNGGTLTNIVFRGTTVTATGNLISNNSIRADNPTTGATTLVLKNATDDAYLRVFTTSTNTYIASSNYGSTASRNLLITGYGGNAMATFTVVSNASVFQGTIQGTTINATANLQEGAVNLTSKYYKLDGTNNITGNVTMSKVSPSVVWSDTDPSYTNTYAITSYQNRLSFRIGGNSTTNEQFNINPSTGIVSTRSGIAYTGTTTVGQAVFDLNNSDIIGANGIHFNDGCTAFGEGLMFIKSTATAGSTTKTDYDNFRCVDGVIYLDNTGVAATNGIGLGNDGRITAQGLASAYTTTNAGNVYSSASGILYRSTSSIAYKEKVEDLWADEYNSVLDLRPVYYKSKCVNDEKDWGYIGLIAEEVAEVQPRLTFFDENKKPSGVQYERVGVMLIPVVKDLLERIKTLESMVR